LDERAGAPRSPARGAGRGLVPPGALRGRGAGGGAPAVAHPAANRGTPAARLSLAGGVDRRGAPARHPRCSARAARAARPRRGRPAADHPLAGAARLHDPALRNRGAAGHRGALPLRPVADRAGDAHRPRRHPQGASRIRRGARASALGPPPRGRPGFAPGPPLRLVALPMASRAILSGIQTSAVINVGTATLGALIGAGGYGQPILTGVRLADTGIILEGAVPAALLALVVQW